ncbi:hypothetical protein P3T23_000835 [Paraburkholderia sp. GAS448]|uniref:hypothetical protein n=1 Tax=Paraburkholderia sp. GAS448 TaxID=3035136 RepID=UPI003D1F5BB9
MRISVDVIGRRDDWMEAILIRIKTAGPSGTRKLHAIAPKLHAADYRGALVRINADVVDDEPVQ